MQNAGPRRRWRWLYSSKFPTHIGSLIYTLRFCPPISVRRSILLNNNIGSYLTSLWTDWNKHVFLQMRPLLRFILMHSVHFCQSHNNQILITLPQLCGTHTHHVSVNLLKMLITSLVSPVRTFWLISKLSFSLNHSLLSLPAHKALCGIERFCDDFWWMWIGIVLGGCSVGE